MNRARRPAVARKPAASVLDTMTGHRLPGGCEDCTAYQTVEQHAPGVYVLTVHHDESCPMYRSTERTTR